MWGVANVTFYMYTEIPEDVPDPQTWVDKWITDWAIAHDLHLDKYSTVEAYVTEEKPEDPVDE